MKCLYKPSLKYFHLVALFLYHLITAFKVQLVTCKCNPSDAQPLDFRWHTYPGSKSWNEYQRSCIHLFVQPIPVLTFPTTPGIPNDSHDEFQFEKCYIPFFCNQYLTMIMVYSFLEMSLNIVCLLVQVGFQSRYLLF